MKKTFRNQMATAIAAMTLLAMASSCMKTVGPLLNIQPDSKVVAALDEGVQKVQYMKPVVDGIFQNLCSAGTISAASCAAYPLIASGSEGALALADNDLKAYRNEATPLNAAAAQSSAVQVGDAAAKLALLWQHPEKAADLAAAQKVQAAASTAGTNPPPGGEAK